MASQRMPKRLAVCRKLWHKLWHNCAPGCCCSHSADTLESVKYIYFSLRIEVTEGGFEFMTVSSKVWNQKLILCVQKCISKCCCCCRRIFVRSTYTEVCCVPCYVTISVNNCVLIRLTRSADFGSAEHVACWTLHESLATIATRIRTCVVNYANRAHNEFVWSDTAENTF